MSRTRDVRQRLWGHRRVFPRLFRLFGLRVVVGLPNHWSYGGVGLDVMSAMALGRKHRAPVVLICPRNQMTEAVTGLRSPHVRTVVPPAWLGAGLGMAAWLLEMPWRLIRAILRRTGVRVSPARRADPYFSRTDCLELLDVFMSPEVEAACAARAQAIGIDPSRPIVAVHARESGFKERVLSRPEPIADIVRNVPLETYVPTIDHLVREGYQVVRIGDPTMRPFSHPGLIDLATSPDWDTKLDLWALLHARFMIAADSGPFVLGFLTDTPALHVGAVNPISSIPLRAPAIFIPKHVVRRSDGLELGWEELLSDDYLEHMRDIARFEYRPSTEEEVLEGAKELMQALESDPGPSPEQARFHEMAAAAAGRLVDHVYMIGRWGPSEDGFLGTGRIGDAYAKKHMRAKPQVSSQPESMGGGQ